MWTELTLLFGGDQRLGQRVADLITRLADGWDLAPDDADLIELAGKYVIGWRPDQFLEQLVGAAGPLPVDPSDAVSADEPPEGG